MKRTLCIVLALMLIPIIGCSVTEESQSVVPVTEPPIAISTPGSTVAPTAELTPTLETTAEPTVTPESTLPPWINPETGKNEVKITIVSVENPDPYEIKQISEKPFVQTEGWVSESAVTTFWKLYEMLPDSIRNDFETDGFKILLTKKDLNENYYDGEVDGFINGIFSYERKMIILYGTDTALKKSVLHEFGHYLDWKNGFASRSDKFKAIYEQEKAAISDPHIDNATEFFAEAFQEQMLTPASNYIWRLFYDRIPVWS